MLNVHLIIDQWKDIVLSILLTYYMGCVRWAVLFSLRRK